LKGAWSFRFIEMMIVAGGAAGGGILATVSTGYYYVHANHNTVTATSDSESIPTS
jgi:hypothetical protein